MGYGMMERGRDENGRVAECLDEAGRGWKGCEVIAKGCGGKQKGCRVMGRGQEGSRRPAERWEGREGKKAEGCGKGCEVIAKGCGGKQKGCRVMGRGEQKTCEAVGGKGREGRGAEGKGRERKGVGRAVKS